MGPKKPETFDQGKGETGIGGVIERGSRGEERGGEEERRRERRRGDEKERRRERSRGG